MPILEVLRDRPLDAEETARLPNGASAVSEPPVVLRATSQLSAPALVELAFAIGRAVKEGTLRIREESIASEGIDPWKLLDAGDAAGAERAFLGHTLDADGRDRVKNLTLSADPQKVALACRIAGLTGWKAFVTNLQRLVTHADPMVGKAARDAITAIEALG